VRQAGLCDYSPAQVLAWAPAPPDQTRYGRCLTLVAVAENDAPLAYAELETDGHIDHFYCHPEVIGTGLGSALYDALEQQARVLKMPKLFVEASEAARRLFRRKGFTTLSRQDFILRGVPIHNYLMEKRL
jgi:putative acetyltransferase